MWKCPIRSFQNLSRKHKMSAKFVEKVKNNKLETAILSIFLFTSFALPTVYATGNSSNTELKKVFHVYLDKVYIGTVDSKSYVNNLIDAKVKENKENYKDLEFTISNDIQFVSELVFQPVLTKGQVKEKLNKATDVEVVTQEIVVDGVPVVQLQNDEDAEQVLDTLKEQYVSRATMDRAARKTREAVNAPLEANQSVVTSVSFLEDVEVRESSAPISELKKVDQAVQTLKKGATKPTLYKVQEGDVLGSIAKKHNLKMRDLLSMNPKLNEDSLLQIGQAVNVTALKPLLSVAVYKNVAANEKINYSVKYVNDSKMYKGNSKVTQTGKEGTKLVNYSVIEVNGKIQAKKVISQKITSKPREKVIAKGTKVIPSRGTGSLQWPAYGGYISSPMGYRWGKLHKGIDIAGPSGYSIRAADNGTVVSAGWDSSGYGNKIVINHNNGMRTVYAHLSSIGVSVGQTVQKGQSIGVMGSTGNSTGTHLHFEVYEGGGLRNPQNYF